ncbi:hypothetical protein C8R47DRAFT_1222078 [Mycena vitilis]|nr:hypothetical protein C8R47DRAFT_1222078 [Mycena vitilis]
MTTVASAPAPSFAPMHDQMGRARSRSPVKSTPSSPELRRTPSSSSLSSVHQHHTHTPSAADLKPNAHPYPIATTATGVLSRSNSLSSSPNQTRHHYVPPSPSAGRREREDANASNNDNGERLGERGEGEGHKKKKEERRAEYRGHRYSRSLSSSEDMYTFLPSPSSASTHGASGSPGPRALPVPPGVSANSIAAKSAAASGSYGSYALSPKRWTPAQLAAHLDRTVSPEAGAWAADRGVGGKAFMRLGEMGEEELVGMGGRWGEGDSRGEEGGGGVCAGRGSVRVARGVRYRHWFTAAPRVVFGLSQRASPHSSSPPSPPFLSSARAPRTSQSSLIVLIVFLFLSSTPCSSILPLPLSFTFSLHSPLPSCRLPILHAALLLPFIPSYSSRIPPFHFTFISSIILPFTLRTHKPIHPSILPPRRSLSRSRSFAAFCTRSPPALSTPFSPADAAHAQFFFPPPAPPRASPVRSIASTTMLHLLRFLIHLFFACFSNSICHVIAI